MHCCQRVSGWIILVCLVVLVPVSLLAEAQDPDRQPVDPDQVGLQWLYESQIIVEEILFAMGNNWYAHLFYLWNSDTSPIWHFGIYFNEPMTEPVPPWYEHPDWFTENLVVPDEVPAVFDATNVDPSIVQLVHTWGPGGLNTGDPIYPGEEVSGMYFQWQGGDLGSKLYFYETLDSGSAEDTGYVAAIGYSFVTAVPNEGSSWGAIKMLYRP